MPTVVTHTAIAATGAHLFRAPADMRIRLYMMAAVCAVLPDLDVIGYHWFNVPYGHVLGHRGFFHSPFFAAVVSLAVVCIFFRRWHIFSRRWWGGVVFFFFLGASHGLLDAMTNGGRGIALLSPFSNQRFFLPWTPIEVSPLGIERFMGPRGIAVLKSEAVWIWLPLAAATILDRAVRLATKRNSLPEAQPPIDDGV
jgi:inner membrane protein